MANSRMSMNEASAARERCARCDGRGAVFVDAAGSRLCAPCFKTPQPSREGQTPRERAKALVDQRIAGQNQYDGHYGHSSRRYHAALDVLAELLPSSPVERDAATREQLDDFENALGDALMRAFCAEWTAGIASDYRPLTQAEVLDNPGRMRWLVAMQKAAWEVVEQFTELPPAPVEGDARELVRGGFSVELSDNPESDGGGVLVRIDLDSEPGWLPVGCVVINEDAVYHVLDPATGDESQPGCDDRAMDEILRALDNGSLSSQEVVEAVSEAVTTTAMRPLLEDGGTVRDRPPEAREATGGEAPDAREISEGEHLMRTYAPHLADPAPAPTGGREAPSGVGEGFCGPCMDTSTACPGSEHAACLCECHCSGGRDARELWVAEDRERYLPRQVAHDETAVRLCIARMHPERWEVRRFREVLSETDTEVRDA